jgi:uncharacterized membrane protein YqiK
VIDREQHDGAALSSAHSELDVSLCHIRALAHRQPRPFALSSARSHRRRRLRSTGNGGQPRAQATARVRGVVSRCAAACVQRVAQAAAAAASELAELRRSAADAEAAAATATAEAEGKAAEAEGKAAEVRACARARACVRACL